jgi:hypothetical protein
MMSEAKPKPPRSCRRDFLKGPIPWSWLVRAMALPGAALAVALILWREAGIVKRLTVAAGHSRNRRCGILPDAGRRALRNLEKAGLVSIARKPGRGLEVTILEVENDG